MQRPSVLDWITGKRKSDATKILAKSRTGPAHCAPPRAIRARAVLQICLVAMALFGTAQRSRAADPQSVRHAIADLTARYGAEYPSGPAFRAQLEVIAPQLAATNEAVQRSAQAALDQLQRQVLLAHPLLCRQPLLFVVRQQYRPDHHNTATFFPSAQHEYNNGHFTPGGALKTIDFAKGGAVRTLLDLPQGVIRDPEVYFDGSKIVFAMRRDAADEYHIYELNTDGSGLRQLTSATAVDDLDPLYLPDDSIAFSSTREPKYCMCNRHIMANLFRMEADGANIHQIGKSTLFEGHGTLMPDGRILYDRWEYVDRNFGDAQSLWTVNPDGTSHLLFWGNNTASPGAVIDARIIPGTQQALCIFGSCHDRPWGALAIVDPALGTDGPEPVVRIWPESSRKLIRRTGNSKFDAFKSVRLKYEDPWPLDAHNFLCARMTGHGEQTGLYLLDWFGNEVLLHTEAPGCFDPMPLGPRPRPPEIPARRNFANQEGFFYVQDVYQGTHLEGVRHGAIKWLRIVESPEKRFWTGPAWGGQGQEAPAMNWHDFNNKRILGTVPVAEDGSAYFAVPSDTFVYFQLLDQNRMMVQSMRSGTIVQSGEQATCIGCHEDRRTAPPPAKSRKSAIRQALRQGPMRPRGWHGPTREFNYLAEVQPVFNRHCVRCHDFGKPAGEVLNLAPDRDLVFNVSYNELWRKKFIRAIGAGPPETQPAYSWGAHASRLVKALQEEHCPVQLSPDEFDRIVTWIDLNAPYYPSYASAYPDNLAGRAPLANPQLARLEQLTGVPLRRLAGHGSNRGPQISFDRPELSPCLAKLAKDNPAAYAEALAIIRGGQQQLAQHPQADQPGFVACSLDQWRQEKYLARQAVERQNRAALRSGQKRYDQPVPAPATTSVP